MCFKKSLNCVQFNRQWAYRSSNNVDIQLHMLDRQTKFVYVQLNVDFIFQTEGPMTFYQRDLD